MWNAALLTTVFFALATGLSDVRFRDKCIYKGTVYNRGDRLQHDNPCLVCHCGGVGRPEMICVPIECAGQVWGALPPPGCRYTQKAGECCSSIVCDETPQQTEDPPAVTHQP